MTTGGFCPAPNSPKVTTVTPIQPLPKGEATMRSALTTVACLAALTIQVAHAETPSSVLQSLPAEVQKNIEDIREGCREHLKTIEDDRIKIFSEITSGDDGLVQFTLSGAPAVMVDNGRLCGGLCIKGLNCTTGGFEMTIYVRSGSAWKTAHKDGVRNDIFLSLDNSSGAFRAMVLGISAASKDCPRRLRTWWKRPCDVIVRWNGAKFTYEALVRD